MGFTSLFFLLGYLPIFIILFYLINLIKIKLGKEKFFSPKKFLLFIANLLFMLYGGVEALIFSLIISLGTWFFCRALYYRKSKLVLLSGCIIILLPLLYIKYYNFVFSNFNNVFSTNISLNTIALPLGISFYTFQALSLMFDVYTEKVQDLPRFSNVITYMMFFPTVTSGPIVRYQVFVAGMEHKVGVQDLNDGIRRFAVGISKKVLIADKIAPLANYYFDGVKMGNVSLSAVGLWMGAIAYSLQIYFDFSGYSDMAIGIAKMIGFSLPENFNKPYQAKSIREFWRRWHITLSQWFRDYVYIPLGGNRCKNISQVRNLLVVWILTGLWHGANWTFVAWGMGYFLLLLFEKYGKKCAGRITNSTFGHFYALFFINLLWIFFRSDSIHSAFLYMRGMFTNDLLTNFRSEIGIRFIPFMVFAMGLCFPWGKILTKVENKMWFRYIKDGVLWILVLLSICACINSTYTPYIYGKF